VVRSADGRRVQITESVKRLVERCGGDVVVAADQVEQFF
jgi:hypothetical protein